MIFQMGDFTQSSGTIDKIVKITKDSYIVQELYTYQNGRWIKGCEENFQETKVEYEQDYQLLSDEIKMELL